MSWAHEQVAKGEYACLLASTKAAENEANCKEKPGLADAASAVARVSEEVLAEAQRKAAGKAGAPHSSVFGHPAAQQATECPIEAHQTLARAIDKYNVLHDAAARDAKSAAAAAAASDAGPGVPKEAKQKPINKIDSTVMRKLLFERERITPAVALAALDKCVGRCALAPATPASLPSLVFASPFVFAADTLCPSRRARTCRGRPNPSCSARASASSARAATASSLRRRPKNGLTWQRFSPSLPGSRYRRALFRRASRRSRLTLFCPNSASPPVRRRVRVHVDPSEQELRQRAPRRRQQQRGLEDHRARRLLRRRAVGEREGRPGLPQQVARVRRQPPALHAPVHRHEIHVNIFRAGECAPLTTTLRDSPPLSLQNQCQSCFEKKPHHAQYVADLGQWRRRRRCCAATVTAPRSPQP